MGPRSQLFWGCLLLSVITPVYGAAIVSKQSLNSTTEVHGTCRATISPFDYSAKTRQEYELPVCSKGESQPTARRSVEPLPLNSNHNPIIGQASTDFLFGRQVVGGDDYSCGPDRPCKNGACCPKETLQCNYGDEYCGTSGISPNDKCWSNCDAKAECGRNAKVPGQKCPLNVCCGKWGFCGMTKDFCQVEDNGATGGCQSNCEQPGPKDGDSEQLDRVIGYYEAWRHNSACQDMSMDQIPVNSLTHLYFSFAFITPEEYNIIGMDGLPNELFSQFTDLKQKNPALKVIIAIGGWTHNDPGPLQKVFSNMVSTKANRSTFIRNLMAFLRRYAFDGVDFDWEYPGAEDRGGSPEDGVNFTQFLKELDEENNRQPKKYVVSYTAPTSFWYMRHFDLKSVNHVDFINVMSYDLHGVWDRDNPIGAYIYGHTNLTEMSLAFDLFWRNDVPARKLNMGLGFYGRAFQLADPACSKPGCLFKGGATKGACSGESGILSYREIKEIIDTKKLTPVHDKEAGVKYITWNSDQWVSYDDMETFAQKKELAKKLGLGGFLIWAIDQDDENLSALQAVLDPKPLGDFYRLGDKNDDNWTGTNELCYVSACGDTTCKPGFIFITDQKCGDDGKKSQLCCPLSGAPSDCQWRSKGPWCEGRCQDDEVMTHMSKYGGGQTCWDGQMAHCCKSPLGQENTCYWGGVGQQCNNGDLPLTFSGTILDILDDIANVVLQVVGRAIPLVALTGKILLEVLDLLDLDTKKLYCCPEADIEKWTNCNWYGQPGNCFDGHCPDMKFVQLTDSYFGGGETCGFHDRVRTFCCESAGDPLFLPVPLDRLFPHPAQGESVDTDFTLKVDQGSADGDDDPNEAAFQFVIMASPEELQVSLDKRDGSHWEVFGCEGTTAEREHTVNIVCTDFTPDSNCGKISLGHGVPGTILQMPRGCGPGKYAVAKSMFPAQGDHGVLLPRHLSHLRALKPVVYDLTFDYNFARVPTDMGTTQMRIDFSNQDDYWDTIVSGSVTRKKRDLAKRTLADVGGSHVRWLEEEFRDDMHLNKIDKRDLHERWFGSSILEWLARLVKPQIEREFMHHYDDTVTAKLVDDTWECSKEDSGVSYKGHLLAQALLNIKVQSSFGFTLIVEKMSRPLDLSQSYLSLYNKGEVTGIVTLEAVAQVTYHKQSVILDLPFPGASFRIPGIVTIGPQLTVEGSIDASLKMAGIVETKLQIAKWDVRQVVPAANDGEYKPTLVNDSEADFEQTGDFGGLDPPEFYAGIDLIGDVTTTLSAAAEFGIRFHGDWGVEPAAAGVVGEVSLLTKFEAGQSTTATCPVTFGVDVGARLFARAVAPEVFGWSGGEYDLTPTWKKAIIEGGTCPELGPIPTKRGLEMREARDLPGRNRSLPAGDLASRLDARPKPLSKRGGVYGPAFSVPIGELFCPRAAGGGNGTGCNDVPPAWGEIVGDEADSERTGVNKARQDMTHKHGQVHNRHHDGHIHILERENSVKPIRACNLVMEVDYPREGLIKATASAWGWVKPDVCTSFDWGGPLATRAVPFAKVKGQTGSLAYYDSEHVLEAQLVGDFFTHMKTRRPRLPDPANQNVQIGFCDYLEKLWNINPVLATQQTNRLDSVMGANTPLEPLDHIGYQFPGLSWKRTEFVSLQRDINSPAKANAWADNNINDSGWDVGEEKGARGVLKSLRIHIGSRLYHTDPEIKRIFNLQKGRIGTVLRVLDTDILPNNPPNGMAAWTPMNLENEWDAFIRGRFVIVRSRTTQLVDKWLLKLNRQWTNDAVQLFYQDKPTDTPAVKDAKKAARQLIEDIQALDRYWTSMPAWGSIFT